MKEHSNQGPSILKVIFSNIRKRISLLVSLFLMLILSCAIISSLFLSDSTLDKLGKSQYFQSKVRQALEENEISSVGLISIKFNMFSNADIRIEKANISSISKVIGHDINLKVDFLKYWLGLSRLYF